MFSQVQQILLCILYFVDFLTQVLQRVSNRGQAEKEFRVEVEAIGHVRHKNLVRLLGYCVEGTHRCLFADFKGI